MDVFEALADPVRRTILEYLYREPLTVNAIVERFQITRPAISRHLRVLREAGLVSVVAQGRTRTDRIRTERLTDVSRWIATFEDSWDQRFDALETEVYRTRFERERDESSIRDPKETPTEYTSEEESA